MERFNLYEKTIKKELAAWEREILRPPGAIKKAANMVQTKTQSFIPHAVQDFITVSVREMTEIIMLGSALLTEAETAKGISLGESDYLLERVYKEYNRLAVAQGFSFGLGGVLLGMADLPALLTIKIKFLFDCAKCYGFDVNDESERLFMLYVFQLAFSSDRRRLQLYPIIKRWDGIQAQQVDWEAFQMEYRDYIDLAKMLQLMPVVGSVVGGAANYNLLKQLKVTAMNSYRLRVLSDSKHW